MPRYFGAGIGSKLPGPGVGSSPRAAEAPVNDGDPASGRLWRSDVWAQQRVGHFGDFGHVRYRDGHRHRGAAGKRDHYH